MNQTQPNTPPAEAKEPWMPKVGDWIIAKASYCAVPNDRECTNITPCPECLEMCNRFVIAGEHYGLLFFNPQLCNRDGKCTLDETCCDMIAVTPEAVPIFLKPSEGKPATLDAFMPDPSQAYRDKLAGEIAELRKRAKDVSQEEANELQDILRTLTNSGTALKTSARGLVKRLDTLRAELERCGEAINLHIDIEAKLRAELESVRKERDEANERGRLAEDIAGRWASEASDLSHELESLSNEAVGIIPTAETPTEASPDVSKLGVEAASHLLPTPETDIQVSITNQGNGFVSIVQADFARKLERERDATGAFGTRDSWIKPPEVMFAVYCRQPGSDVWFQQETNPDESEIRYWSKRNNDSSADLYDPPREYIPVKVVTTYTKLS